jgi:hypothetical protein
MYSMFGGAGSNPVIPTNLLTENNMNRDKKVAKWG